jgi:hypothetical protein
MEKTPEELEVEAVKLEAETKAKADAEAKAKEETDRHEKLTSLSDEEKVNEILALRSEAKERRLKEKEISEKLSEFEKKQADEIEKDKKAKGKYDEIITDLKKKLEEFEPLANKYKEYDETKRQKIKESLTEKELWIESFAKLDLSELEALDEKFSKTPKKVPTDDSKNFVPKGKADDREPWEKLMS